MSKKDIPRKQEHGPQADYALQPSEADNAGNTMPDELEVDAGELFIQATEQTRMALCVSDPHKPDSPIVYLNEAFSSLTGYDRDEVLGNNCRFLQGKDTNPGDVQRIRSALAAEKVAVIDILNYRKDGTPFWNALHIGPIYDSAGKLQYFYGSQWDVTEVLRSREEAERARQVADEMQHRTGNLFAVLSAIVRMSARGETNVEALTDKIERRLGALARAHRITIGSEDAGDEGSGLRGLVETVLEPYRSEERDRILIKGDELTLPLRAITPIGLTLHELATNALKYGSLAQEGGTVDITWADHEDSLTICWVERGGPPPASDGKSGSGTGTRIVSGILAGIDATIERNFDDEGLSATITLPATLEIERD